MRASVLISMVAVAATLFLCACGSGDADNVGGKTGEVTVNPVADDMPLNLSVYLDLSDRLVKGKGAMTQVETDTALLNFIVDSFVKRCKSSNILTNKDCFQVLFYPQPKQKDINLIAKSLKLDLKETAVTGKKKAVTDFQNSYKDNITAIYETTLKTKKWNGSDIWGFFSNKKVDQCCIKDGYRNVLIIITDGFIFHVNNKVKDGTAYSYVLPSTLAVDGSSLIVKRAGLESLEVLMLEVDPSTPAEHDAMIAVLTNWFDAMGVKQIVINETDIEANTEVVISNFLKQ